MSEDKVVPMKDQNALVMGDGKVYKIQKVRQRKIHSCVPCHQRKIKCSREHPICGNCSKNALECKYFVNDRVSRGKKNKDFDKAADIQKKQELKKYMAKAKTMVDDSPVDPDALPIETPSNSTPDTSPSPPSVLPEANIDQKLTQSVLETTTKPARKNLKKSVANHSASPTQSSNDESFVSRDKNLTYSDSDSSESTNESLSPPHLHNPQVLPTEKTQTLFATQQHQRIESNNAMVHGPTPSSIGGSSSGLFDSNNNQPLSNSILNDFQVRQTTPSTSNIRNQYNDYSLPSAAQVAPPITAFNLSLPAILLPKQPDQIPVQKLEEIFSALPSKERCYGLVRRYIKVIHPILPILDVKEFVEQHDLFWDNKIPNKLEFISLLLTVLYAASKSECFEFSYDEITKFELSNEIHKYLRVARVALTAINYPQVYSLRVLQGAVILQSTLENPSLIDVSILVRIAQMIKLHRDPATYHNISDPSLVQLRRLLWWQIFYLDSMTSLKQMSTPMIRLDEFDTSLPVEYINNSLHYEMCFLNGKFRYTLILNELTRFIYGIAILPFNTIQVLKQKILDLHISCNASIQNLENFERSRQLTFEEGNFISWSKSVLSTYCDRAVLLLQKKIILANVLNTNEDGNNQIFNNSYNQMVNNKKSQFSIDSVFKSANSNSFLTSNPGSSNGSSNDQYSLSSPSYYSFDDLSNNLIPASLHYLYEFLRNNNDDIYNGFNWEIRNNLPFDAIILILTNLISDLEKNHNNQSYELRNDIRYHILDKSIDLIFIKFDNKKRSIIKNCFTLIRYLFQILRLKYLRNDSNNNLIEFETLYTEQMIPKPISGSPNPSDIFKRNNSINQNNSQASLPPQTTSCSQIAPRTMRALAGSSGSISFSQSSNLNGVSVSDMFVNGLTSDVNFYGGTGFGATGMINNSLNDASVDEGYKEHELQRIKSQITKFLREERLGDDDPFNNRFYIGVEKEVRQLIERLIR